MESKKFKIFIEETRGNYGRLYIEPLERGYGDTLGNALRRLLLSSIKGAAVTALRIDGVLHEFSTIKGVREDVIEILLNLKHIPIRVKHDLPPTEEYKIFTVDTNDLPGDFFTREKNPGVITIKDLLPWDNFFEFVENPDHNVICTLEPGAEITLEIYVAQGVGYLSAERERPSNLPLDAMLSDAIFSPVTRVNYEIEPARVEQSIDYERLILEVWTNGTISPQRAVAQAAEIAESYFKKIADDVSSAIKLAVPEVKKEDSGSEPPGILEHYEKEPEIFSHPIHDLDLSIRSENCLLRGGMNTIGELIHKSRDELLKIRNLGRKSLTEIEERIASMGYSLAPSRQAASTEVQQETPETEITPEQELEAIFEDKPEAEPVSEETPVPEEKPETEPAPEETPEPEAKPKSKSKSKSKAKAKTEPEPEPEAKSDDEAKSEPEPEAGAGAEAKSKKKRTTKKTSKSKEVQE